MAEFSHQTRAASLTRFTVDTYDLLIVGGGITGAAVARDAASRGLKVALVDRGDFASGTSSKSSKLIHGGLRYLENMEFGLVFEALSERALLLKTVPTMVRPLKFYFPVFKGDAHGKGILGLGMWLYDLLAIFRTPGIHRSLSRKRMIAEVPVLKQDDLVGGFTYYDASMWDDVLAVQILRSAHEMGAQVVNYVEALSPLLSTSGRIEGYTVRDREKPEGQGQVQIRAHQTVICAGPWTDLVGKQLGAQWQQWLMPSKGVHLVFDHSRLPVPGALVMSHPQDGRISFVIPRPDYGAGVTIVGTTDGPTPLKPEEASVDFGDVKYLLELLDKYFPTLKLTTTDIISAYVGVRPLMGPSVADQSDKASQVAHANHLGDDSAKPSLQKVSREHHIGEGPGSTVVVAGGKYTTHRKMAEEIVTYALNVWRRDYKDGKILTAVPNLSKSKTKEPSNPEATPAKMTEVAAELRLKTGTISREDNELVERYGAEARAVLSIAKDHTLPAVGPSVLRNPLGFPELASQLRHAMRTEMVIHLEDFYLRRVPLYLARADHGLPWAEALSKVWAEERKLTDADAARELEQLRAEIERRSSWQKGLFK